MWMSILKPEITGKHWEKRKNNNLLETKEYYIPFFYTELGQGGSPPFPGPFHATILNISFPKMQLPRFDLKTDFGYETP